MQYIHAGCAMYDNESRLDLFSFTIHFNSHIFVYQTAASQRCLTLLHNIPFHKEFFKARK